MGESACSKTFINRHQVVGIYIYIKWISVGQKRIAIGLAKWTVRACDDDDDAIGQRCDVQLICNGFRKNDIGNWEVLCELPDIFMRYLRRTMCEF